MKPQTDTALAYRDETTALEGLYLHDDRLGPYAAADIYSFTDTKSGAASTVLRIRWPGSKDEAEHLLLRAIVVPVPAKIRLSVARMRSLGIPLADAAGVLLDSAVILNCRYDMASSYRAKAFQFGLTDDSIVTLGHGLVFSRYIGLIEISDDEGPLLDFVLDATETVANSSVLACVARRRFDSAATEAFSHLSNRLAAVFVS